METCRKTIYNGKCYCQCSISFVGANTVLHCCTLCCERITPAKVMFAVALSYTKCTRVSSKVSLEQIKGNAKQTTKINQ